MAYSKFVILFSESDTVMGAYPSLGQIVSVLETSTSTNFKETLVTSRINTGEFTMPVFTDDNYNTYLGKTLAEAFQIDFNQGLKYDIIFEDFQGDLNGLGRGKCTVTALYPNAVFTADRAHVSPSNIRLQITNVVSAPIITIGQETFDDASTNQCELVKVSVPTTPNAFKLISPVFQVSPTNPIIFDINRGQTIQLVVENSDGIQSSKQIVLPAYLAAANFTPNVITTPSGSTVTIVGINNNGLILEYSLNGTSWQSGNVFTNLTPGNYSFYVRDQLGCQFFKGFTVKEFSNNDITVPIPFVYVSKSNPIRYANRNGMNNDDSKLSYETECRPMYCEKQKWLNTDIIKTQFKSNYTNNLANIVKKDGSKVPVFPIKMSYNMDIKDKRDARITGVNGDNSKTGIYFTTGNTYDYDTNSVIGSYGLYGGLPEWGVIGNYFKIGSIWYLIESVFYDVSKQSSVLVFTLNFVANPNPVIVSTIYDRHNYEVYEFDTDFSAYNNTDVQVEILCTDVYYSAVTYLSEKQQVRTVLDELMLEIQYYNNDNTDIFYNTGFRGLIRLPYQTFEAKPNIESDLHKTDTSVFLLSAVEYEVEEIKFYPMTKEIARKLMRVLAHENVGINGIGYVIEGAFTLDGLGYSNIYNFTASMMKTGSIYSAIVSTDDEISTAPPIDIPQLVITEDGFIAY